MSLHVSTAGIAGSNTALNSAADTKDTNNNVDDSESIASDESEEMTGNFKLVYA